MELLLDILGYFSVVFDGTIVALQAAVIGGCVFAVALALPYAVHSGDVSLVGVTYRGIALAGALLGLALLLSLSIRVSALLGTLPLDGGDVIGAGFVTALAARAGLAAAISYLAWRRASVAIFVVLAFLLLLATLGTSHAAGRIDDRAVLALTTCLHILGASIWIGGLPYFLTTLRRVEDGAALAWVGRRYSLISMAGVAILMLGAAGLAYFYIATPDALYGTAYGLMVTGKTALFAGLLLLGLGNYRLVERLRRDPATPILRLRRFAEVEIGVGLAIFFTAASITSLPPAVDLTADRVTWAEVTERMTPTPPRLTSPDHADLAIPALQAKLDAEAAAASARPAPAFVPGGGELPPRNAFDVAWSEYNHHWAGLFVLAIGLLCLAERTGRAPWAKHWPLLFLLLAAFLFWRSDPEVWPMGEIGLLDSLRDPEVVQHRLAVIVVIAFGLFEWGVRTGRISSPRAALVLPVMVAVGGTLLLTHSHAIANVKQQLLIEMSHLPMAILGITAGAARWLELRLAPPASERAGWVWPICFVLIGAILLGYREA